MEANDEQTVWLAALLHPSDKNWWVTLTLSVFFGLSGLDRIYTGSYGLGFLKFLSVGGCGLWWMIDLCLLVSNRMRDAQGNVIRRPF